MSSLAWLSNLPNLESWTFCLTFVRNTEIDEVFQRFGTDPNQPASSVVPSIPFPDRGTRQQVLGRRIGDWVALLDDTVPCQALRPEVLRRISAGTEAVALYHDIAKANHEFAHAYDSEGITMVTNSVPPHWRGSQPDRLRPLAEELSREFGYDGSPEFEVLLALMDGVFGLSLDPETLSTPWQAVPLLPVLDDLPPEHPGQDRPHINDPVSDLLIKHVMESELPRLLSARCERVMTETGVNGHPVLASAVQEALAGAIVPVTDDDPLGIALRTAERDIPQAATMLRLVLAGRSFDALISDYHLHQISRIPGWREQFISDFGSVDVPTNDMQAAEEIYRDRHNQFPPGAADPRAASAHVRRLIDAGITAETIAGIGGITTRGVQMLLRHEMPLLPEDCSRRILAIEVPPQEESERLLVFVS